MYFRSLKKSAGDVFINDTIDTDKDGNPLTLIDIISDELSIIDSIDLKIKSEQLKKMILELLEPREQVIIRTRYGLDGKAPLTQREVAEKMGISRSYVSRIEKKSISVLQKGFEKL